MCDNYLIYKGHNGLQVIAWHPLEVDEEVLVAVLGQDTPEEGGTSTQYYLQGKKDEDQDYFDRMMVVYIS